MAEQPGLRALWGLVQQQWGNTKFGGIYSNRNIAGTNKRSLHADGRALDIMTSHLGQQGTVTGNQIAAWLVANASTFGVQEIVWNGQTWSAARPYWKPSSRGATDHADHVHVGLTAEGASKTSFNPAASEGEYAMGDMTQEDDPAAFARSTYGYLGAFLDDGTIGPILKRAAAEGWSAERLRGALFATDWWQTTSSRMREWDAKEKLDPAAAEADLAARAAELQDQARTLGITLSGPRLREIARDSLRFGWNEAQLRNALAAEVERVPRMAAPSMRQGFKKMAADYAIPLSDAALDGWVIRAVRGDETEDTFRAYAMEQAKSLFPTIAAAIDAGQTVRQYADPYLQVAAQALGVAPDAMDLQDPKWLAGLVAVDETGNRRPMTLDEWQRHVKADPRYGYDRSANGIRDAYSTGLAIGERFGKVA